MAQFHWRYKWILTSLALSATFSLQSVSSCQPDSKELNICLNIYLERDFTFIETIVKGQTQRGNGRGRVILEGPDLLRICNDISELKDCYSNLTGECDTVWKYDTYTRMMDVLGATHDHLCSTNTHNVRDLLLNSGCLARARYLIGNCSGFDWTMSWREVLRMQVTPADRCPQLDSYRNCLKNRLSDVVCGPEASRVFLALIDVWRKRWCGATLDEDEDRRYFYRAMNRV